MAHVSDPPSKRRDDPSVLASLNDLDRGLDGSESAADDTLAQPTDSTPLVPPGTFGDPDDPPPPLTFTRPEPGDARARRPLLELFPLAASESRLAPMLTKGTA